MKKYKIGYTTGVYDMFHIGHLNVLKAAKEQCDYLIVGVSTDEVSIKNKNKKPIIPFEERATIVSSIKYVDMIVPQTGYDLQAKFDAWKKLNFDVMFVGSDWQGTNKWNDIEEEFSQYGVSISYLPHTDGISSTSLREKIEKNNVLVESYDYE